MKIHNLKNGPAPKGYVFVGRPSDYGNPFSIGKDGTRLEVIEKYREWLREHPEMVAKIKKNLRGKNLSCFCSPLRCHAEVIMEIANE